MAAAGWAIVWVALLATGQGYSIRVLYAGWQMVPYEALVDDPAGSLWHLHTQPPLWNLQAGVVGAVSPGTTVGHAAVSLVTGCVLAAAVCATLRRFGASTWTAWALTAAATLNTQVLVYAFRPQYDLAVAALIAVLVWSVARLEPAGSAELQRASLLVPVSLATALVLTRALYHPLWLVVVAVVVGWRTRRTLDVRRAVACLAVPLVLVGGWVVKNEVVVGRATMSTWTGMNLLRATLPAVDPDRLAQLRDDGTVSGVATIGPFRPYADYAGVVPPCDADPSEHPALRIESRQVPPGVRADGPFDAAAAPNFNFECYLGVYDAASSDAWALMRHAPGAWVTARLWAANNWFEAPAMRPREQSPLWPVLDGMSRIVLLAVPHPGLPAAWADDEFWVHSSRWSLTLAATTIALAVTTLRRRRGTGAHTDAGAQPGVGAITAGRRTAWLVASITVGWTMVAGIGAELGEQQRFRSVTDPIVIALGGLVIVRAVESVVGRPRDRRSESPESSDT